MSDRIGESNDITKGRGRQPYQSSWMDHWMGTNRNASEQTLLNELEVPKSTTGVKLLETKSYSILKDCRAGSKVSGDIDGVQAFFPRDAERGKGMISDSRLGFTPMNSEIQSLKKIVYFSGEGTSKSPLGWLKTGSSAVGSSNAAAAKPLQELLAESSSHVVPYRFDVKKCEADKGKAVAFSSVRSKPASISHSFPNAISRKIEQGMFHDGLESTDLAQYGRMDSPSLSKLPTKAFCREMKPSLFAGAPSSTSDHHLPQFNQGWFHEINKCSSIGLFPMQPSASEKTNAKESHQGHYSLQKFPDTTCDVETMRICTMVDSVVEMPGGCPMFSQTTHSLLITKNTDLNSLKENEMFRSARVVTEIDEKTSIDPCYLSSVFGQGDKGVKLQAFSSSTDSGGKGNMGNFNNCKVTRRNESSAETDTLDMDSLMEKNHHTGTNSSASTKGISPEPDFHPPVAATSSRKAPIPDMNLEPPEYSAPGNFLENAGPSSSRTQSLEMDVLLAHSEYPRPELKLNTDYSTKTDPSSRWVKRLKLNSSSAQTTKSVNLGESLSHEKMSTYFSRIIKNNINSSEPSQHGKEAVSNSLDLSKEEEDFPVDPIKKDAQLVLSHAWIQRWLSNESRIMQKKHGEMVVCEPKMDLEDLEKKQFPSIAAMALMGKAMSGFQPCEVHKRGSFTVWNTKAF